MNSSFQNSNGVMPDFKSKIAAQIDELMQIAVLLRSASTESRLVNDSDGSAHQSPRAFNANRGGTMRPIDALVTQLTCLHTSLLTAHDRGLRDATPRNVVEPRCLQRLVEVLLRITCGRAPDAVEVKRFIEKFFLQEASLQDVVRLVAEPIARLLDGSPASDHAAPVSIPIPLGARRFTENDLRQVIANVLLFVNGVVPERMRVAQLASEITSGRTALIEFMVNELSTDKAVAHLIQLGIVFRSLGLQQTLDAFDARLATVPSTPESLSGGVLNHLDAPLRISGILPDTSCQAMNAVPNGKGVVRDRHPAGYDEQRDKARPQLLRRIVFDDKQIHFETPRFVSNGLNAMRQMGDKAVVTALGVAERLTDVVFNGVSRVADNTYSQSKHLSGEFRDRLHLVSHMQTAKISAEKISSDQPPSATGLIGSDPSSSQSAAIASPTVPSMGGQYYSPLALLPHERNEATLGVPVRDKKNSDEQLLTAATSQIQRLQELLVGRFLFDLPKIEPDTDNLTFSDFLLKNEIVYPIKHVRVLNSTDDIDSGNFQSNRLTMVVESGVKVASASFL
jgi:hypothetical protein